MEANELEELEFLANASLEDVLVSVDPEFGKLIKIAKQMKQAKTFAERMKLLCDAGLLDENVCKYVDRISLLPPEKQLKVLKTLLIREALKKIRLKEG